MMQAITLFTIVLTLVLSDVNCKITQDLGSQVQEGVVYALPILKSTIDGNLDDWPQTIKWNPISRPLKNPEAVDTSRKARFKVAYDTDSNKLLVAVEYFDMYRLVSDSLSNASQDVHILYVDQDRDFGGSAVMHHYANERIVKTGDTDNPRLKEVEPLTSANIISKTRLEGNKVTIEYEVELTAPIKIGHAVGLGHLIVDFNKDNTNEYIVWTKGGSKNYTSESMGTLVFADIGYLDKMGKLQGKIKKPINGAFEIPKYLRIKSLDNVKKWFDVVVDSMGKYRAQLSLGKYTIIPFSNFTSKGEQKKATDIRWIKWDKTLSYSEVLVKRNEEAQLEGPELDLKTLNEPKYPLSLLLDEKNYNKTVIKEELVRYMEYFEIPGVSLAIIKNGEVKDTLILGKANASNGTPLNDKSLFEAASISKPILAFAVMRLVDKGIIDLDEPLYKTLIHPDLEEDPNMKLITARHVLNHTTGFPNWPGENANNKLSINFTHGTSYSYSGAGFEYLKEVIIIKTDRDISSILKEEVLDVFNMKNTYFEENDYLKEHKVHGHLDGNPTRRDFMENAEVASSMHINAAELAKFFIGIRNRKGLLPETYNAYLEFDTRTYSEWEDKTGWKSWMGLGIFLQKTPLGTIFGHSGNNGDFTCISAYFDKQDVGFVLMTNSNKGGVLLNLLNVC
ncbi:CubicO group peptidase, beta-lactamase class C family [Arenibacter palladensis]|uniref:CubicO group peptidase, beta-lactamase class C family n=1 Tax=Arenibacter palladensis TaxID=237373 RepID=A0A1M4Y000_9FLAO|nr:serine hydrolase domain-containing protein [Arenibacter palladensis]SHE98916.1 CubicO group peptidase, beta-lactamase class C family [Arenibacter palladensis]